MFIPICVFVSGNLFFNIGLVQIWNQNLAKKMVLVGMKIKDYFMFNNNNNSNIDCASDINDGVNVDINFYYIRLSMDRINPR